MSAAFRTTMTDLVTEVRRLIGDPAPSSSQEGAAVWLDVDIQDALDDHRIDVARTSLSWVPTFTGSAIEYTTAAAFHDHFERSEGGSAIFVVENASGVNAGTADYTVDYRQGIVTFTANQNGTYYAVSGRSYDVYGAAADLLDWWVARDPADCLISGDGNKYFDRSRANARAALAKQYRTRARPTYAALARGDAN